MALKVTPKPATGFWNFSPEGSDDSGTVSLLSVTRTCAHLTAVTLSIRSATDNELPLMPWPASRYRRQGLSGQRRHRESARHRVERGSWFRCRFRPGPLGRAVPEDVDDEGDQQDRD